jgi:hypothetical protein
MWPPGPSKRDSAVPGNFIRLDQPVTSGFCCMEATPSDLGAQRIGGDPELIGHIAEGQENQTPLPLVNSYAISYV